jgi:uncharacterized protein YsxB (DUF464 family)
MYRFTGRITGEYMISIQKTNSEIVVSGHAHTGDAPLTKQEVKACSAVTAITNTLIGSILELTDDHPDFTFRAGYFWMDTQGLGPVSQVLVQAFVTGAEMLSGVYPECIRL